MRRVREVLRLKFASGMPGREIARRLGVAPSTVRETLKRFDAAGLSWPLADDMTETALEERLYGAAGTRQGHRRHAEPDWAAVHRELKRKHVTLSILMARRQPRSRSSRPSLSTARRRAPATSRRKPATLACPSSTCCCDVADAPAN